MPESAAHLQDMATTASGNDRTAHLVPIDPFLTTEELAEYLSVPIATVYSWRKHGTAPRAHVIGKHLRFRLSDVEAWLSTRAA